MKPGMKLREFTFYLAICGGVFTACFCVLWIVNERDAAMYRLDMYKSDLQGWEACRETQPELLKTNETAVNHCVKSFAEAEGSFWVRLAPRELAALYVLAGPGVAIAGCLVVWLFGRALALLISLLQRSPANPDKPQKKHTAAPAERPARLAKIPLTKTADQHAALPRHNNKKKPPVPCGAGRKS